MKAILTKVFITTIIFMCFVNSMVENNSDENKENKAMKFLQELIIETNSLDTYDNNQNNILENEKADPDIKRSVEEMITSKG